MTTTHQPGEMAGSMHRAVADHVAPKANTYFTVPVLQKKEDEDELQMKAVPQLKSRDENSSIQKKEDVSSRPVNKTGIPDNLKAGIENLSGISLDDVKVHYNSDKPAQLNALAYAQGTDIHVGPGQEQHLPHEAWHVVQQKQGRVRPTIQAKGVAVNDDKGLENEADVMGDRATKTRIDRVFNYESKSDKLINNSWTVQAKKSAPFNLDKKYAARYKFPYKDYKDLDNDGYKNFIYNHAKATYDANLAKGTQYWNNLTNAIGSFKANDNSNFLETLKKKHSDYDARFRKNYINSTKETADSANIEVGSIGLAKKRDKGYIGKDTPYINDVNFEENSITAKHNYADRDRAREKDVEKKGKKRYKPRGLPNSEILWQQYNLVARSQSGIHKDIRTEDLIKRLSVIKRRQVQNNVTQKTILFALPDGMEDLQIPYAWQAESEEFLAMLGTPNCSGAAFLLADHVDDLNGKSITEIELLGGEDVNLDIKIG